MRQRGASAEIINVKSDRNICWQNIKQFAIKIHLTGNELGTTDGKTSL